MKFGMRTPSLKKSHSARTSPTRIIKNTLGLKAPRGYGFLTNPKRQFIIGFIIGLHSVYFHCLRKYLDNSYFNQLSIIL